MWWISWEFCLKNPSLLPSAARQHTNPVCSCDSRAHYIGCEIEIFVQMSVWRLYVSLENEADSPAYSGACAVRVVIPAHSGVLNRKSVRQHDIVASTDTTRTQRDTASLPLKLSFRIDHYEYDGFNSRLTHCESQTIASSFQLSMHWVMKLTHGINWYNSFIVYARRYSFTPAETILQNRSLQWLQFLKDCRWISWKLSLRCHHQ